MPIVQSINGIVETYPVRPVTPREPVVDAVDSQTGKEQRQLAGDRTQLAAQQAYQEQTRQARPPKPAILAKDLMTAPVVTLPSDATIVDAWVLMTRRSFRHLPISSVHGTLVGMVSDRDLIRHAPDLVIAGIQSTAARRRLAEIMSPRVLSATPATDIREIARVMMDERVGALPILDIDRRPV
ncbi:MAG: acetoin utilization protein AcuB, partial [Nitrospirota bacterium]|nr:acetoin utilization protein AcuB [Nitrospirota bacterium]